MIVQINDNLREFVNFKGIEILNKEATVLKELQAVGDLQLTSKRISEDSSLLFSNDKIFQVVIQDNSVVSLSIRCFFGMGLENYIIYKDHPCLESIKVFSSLAHLSLSGLNLNKVPEWIQYLSELASLDLSCNRIRNLPIFLLTLNKLRFLNISYNPLDIDFGILGSGEIIDGLPNEPLRLEILSYMPPTLSILHQLVAKGIEVNHLPLEKDNLGLGIRRMTNKSDYMVFNEDIQKWVYKSEVFARAYSEFIFKGWEEVYQKEGFEIHWENKVELPEDLPVVGISEEEYTKIANIEFEESSVAQEKGRRHKEKINKLCALWKKEYHDFRERFEYDYEAYDPDLSGLKEEIPRHIINKCEERYIKGAWTTFKAAILTDGYRYMLLARPKKMGPIERGYIGLEPGNITLPFTGHDFFPTKHLRDIIKE